MSIRKRKDNGAWEVHIVATDPTGNVVKERKSSTKWRKRDAEAFEREVRAAIAAGTYGATKQRDTFSEFAGLWLETHVAVECAPTTYNDREGILRNHLKPFFGEMKLDQIGTFEIVRFKAHQQRKTRSNGNRQLSDRTINNHLGILSAMFNHAVEWEKLDSAPKVKLIKIKHSDKPKFDYLNFGETQRVIEAADPELRPMFIVGFKTGLRPGELFAVRWEDVDLVQKRMCVQRTYTKRRFGPTKGGRGRHVPLTNEAMAALRQIEKRSKLRGNLVFSDADGEPFTISTFRRVLKRACRKAGVKHVTPKALRHTFASHLVMRGKQLPKVQKLLGHANLRTTERYAHLAPAALRDAVDCLDDDAPEWSLQQHG
jgi:integrase